MLPKARVIFVLLMTLRVLFASQLSHMYCQHLCVACSHLLEEDLEPFEVLPNGRINPSLLMALRILFESQAIFSSWSSWEGEIYSALKARGAKTCAATALQCLEDLPTESDAAVECIGLLTAYTSPHKMMQGLIFLLLILQLAWKFIACLSLMLWLCERLTLC